MSQIVKHKASFVPKEILEQLPTAESRIVALSNTSLTNKRVSDLQFSERVSFVSILTKRIDAKLGLKERTPEANKTHLRLMNVELDKFSNLTVNEITTAVEAGLDGEFLGEGEQKVYFNFSFFVRWIKQWIEQVKKPAMKLAMEKSGKLELPAPELTERQILISRYQLFLKAVLDYAETGKDFIDAGGLIYDFLLKFNRLEPVSKEQLERAAAVEMQKAKLDHNRSKVKEMSSILEKLLTTEIIEESPAHSIASRSVVIAEIKKVGSWPGEDQIDYFDSLKIDMEEYFKTINTP